MNENMLPDKIPDSPLKQQGSSRKKSSNHKPALGQRSPLKDIVNHPSEAKTVKKDIKKLESPLQFGAVYQLHEEEGWHEGTDHTGHHKFSYTVDEDIRISSDMVIPSLAMGKVHYREIAKFHEVTGVSLGDSESEYESAEDLEETEKPIIQKIASLTPVVNSTLVQATSSAYCSPDGSDDVFENSLLNSFENLKIADTDEPTLEENFHDASDVMENIVTLSLDSRKVHEENRSTEIKITEQPAASFKKESENLPNKNEYSCVASLDKKDSSQCNQSVTERTVDVEPLRKETTEKKEAMLSTGKERSDELVENVNSDQICNQMKFMNKVDDTDFDLFAKKMKNGNSPNKMGSLFVTEGETSYEMALTTVVVEATETVLQKEGIIPEKKDNIMEKEDAFLGKNDPVLEGKHTVSEESITVLVNECNALEKKDTNSEEEDIYIEIEEAASEKGDTSSEKEFTASEKEQTSLERRETSMEREDASQMLEKLSLGREDSPLQKEDTFVMEKKAEVSFENGGLEPIIKDEGTSLHKGHKVNFLNLEDLTSYPVTAESYVMNPPDTQDSAYNVQSATEEEICDSSTLMILPKSNTTDNTSGKELSDDLRKGSIPQQNAVVSCVGNLHNKADGIHISEFVMKETPNDKSIVNSLERENFQPVDKEEPQSQTSETEVVLGKKEMSELSKEKVTEEPVVDEISHPHKTHQIDFVNMLNDPDLSNFTTTPIIANPLDESGCTVVDKEEMHSGKQDIGTVLEKMETSVLEEMVGLEGNTSSQRDCKMNFLSKLGGSNFNAISPSSSVANSVKKNFTIVNNKGAHESDRETSLLLDKVGLLKDAEKDKSYSQKGYQMDSQNNVDDSFTTKSDIVNSPEKKEFSVVNGKETQSQKPKTDVTPQKEIDTQLKSEKKETSSQKKIIKESVKDDSIPKECNQMDFLSKLGNTNFNPFKTKAVVQNSPVREENAFDIQIETKKETNPDDFMSKVIIEKKSDEGKTSVSQESNVRDSTFDTLSTKSTMVNSPNKEEFAVVDEKTQSQKAKADVTPKVKQEKEICKKETHSSQMDFLSKLDDTNFDPFKAKAVVQNSPVREENAFNKQVKTEKETSPDDFMSRVMLEKKSDEGKPPVSQESNVRDSTFNTLSTKSTIMNSLNKEEFAAVDKEKTQSQKAKTGITLKMKQEKQVICEKETHSSQKEVIEAAVKDGLPPQKCYQMDFLSKLDDPNFDPFATKSSVVNSPEKKDISVVNEEETQSQELNTGKIPENKQVTQVICKEKETQVSLQKVVFGAAMIEDTPVQKCYQMSNLDDPTFDPFRTKAAVQNSPVGKENAFNMHMKTEEKINNEESGLKGVTEERDIKKIEREVTKSDQSKGPVFQENSKSDCHEKVDQNVILKSEEAKKVMSVVTSSTCQVVEQKQESTEDQCDVFSPLPKGRTRTQGYSGTFNLEEEFTSASDFFNTPEDLDVLGTHGTEGDKLNLVRNSLYVKFDPLVSGRQSLAPYLAQQVKESELDPRRCSGLISFSPSPIKHQRDSDNTGTPVRALLSTRADETVLLDATDLDNTTVTDGGNTTFVSCNQTFNNTVICSSAPDSANETIIHQPVVSVEKMVTEREMNDKLKNMELIMQDNELRKCREYEEVQKSLKQQMMENAIALTALEEENSTLKSSIQQMQDTLTKILEQYKAKKKECRNQLQLLKNKYELKCAALQKECQQYHDELKKSEVPFFDLVKKYERLREVLESLQKNEESLKSDIERLKTKMAEKDENFKTVIQTYEDQLGMTENEKRNLKQNHEQELKKASVMLKKAEVKILSLTEMVEKLNTEKGRLTDLLEDITNNMGTTSAM